MIQFRRYIKNVGCPETRILMNYTLGKLPGDPAVRRHLANCKKCARRLRKLEQELLDEGLELQDQASYPMRLEPQPPALDNRKVC